MRRIIPILVHLLVAITNPVVMADDLTNKNVISIECVIRPVELPDATLYDVVANLRRQGIPMCLACTDAASLNLKKPISIGSVTLVKSLDTIVQEYSGYIWTLSKDKSLIYVLPRNAAVLDWMVPRVELQGVGFLTAVEEQDVLELGKHQVQLFQRGPLQKMMISISASFANLTAFECLERLMSQLEGVCWTIIVNPKGTFTMWFDVVT